MWLVGDRLPEGGCGGPSPRLPHGDGPGLYGESRRRGRARPGSPWVADPGGERLHDGGLWERLVGCRPGLAALVAVLTADWDALSSDEGLDALLVLGRSGAGLGGAG